MRYLSVPRDDFIQVPIAQIKSPLRIRSGM
jgi:hypothetical protein